MNVAGQVSDSQPVSFTPTQSGVVFPDRRGTGPDSTPTIERRQFANTHSDISEEARSLGQAIDQYKLVHRRRFITYEEMLGVIKSLGYQMEN